GRARAHPRRARAVAVRRARPRAADHGGRRTVRRDDRSRRRLVSRDRRPRGRIVLVGTLAGGSSAFPILVAMGKRLTVMGTVLRARSNAEKAEVTDAF